MLLSRVLTGAMLMGGISTKPHTFMVCGSWRIVGSWSNRPPQQKHHVLVLCGVVVSLVVPDLIQHVTVFGGVVGGCGVVVWLLHSGREHLVRMTPVWVLFSCM